MRPSARWAFPLVLLVCAGGLVGAQETTAPDKTKPAAGPWYSQVWPFGGTPDKKSGSAPPPVVDSPATLRARAEAALHRRQAVCLELRRVAAQTGDADLETRAEQLEELAFETYLSQVARLPAEGGFQSDEQLLAERLGPNAGPRRAGPSGGQAALKAPKEERR